MRQKTYSNQYSWGSDDCYGFVFLGNKGEKMLARP